MDAAGPVRCLIADKGCDANTVRKRLKTEGVTAVTPAGRTATNRSVTLKPLPRPLAHRGRILQAEGVPAHRNALREARAELPVRRRARNPHRLMGLTGVRTLQNLRLMNSAWVCLGRWNQLRKRIL
jgi:hypothetical protein